MYLVRSDLIDSHKSPQAEVFDYLFSFIKQADLFVSVSAYGMFTN